MHQRTRPTDAPALGHNNSGATDPGCTRHILLVELGVSILKTVCHPEVLTVFRLAIAESDRVPEIARTLDSSGREANQKALTELLRKAQARGLVLAGDPAVLAVRYLVVLWGDLLIRLLMRVRAAPTEREIEVRARAATETLINSSSKLGKRKEAAGQ
ncbi:MAG TPA: TetR/AcrR family transcriptional regulator C-terminal domain-containing protein [Chthoniobacterales bacterium]|nr:TetR/AcrR family transcriptional regulator C-terminal domain-containing protein [Chthoniobacterales bacterium]